MTDKRSRLAEALVALCDARRLSMRAASLAATNEADTIRNIVRGLSKKPRIDTLQALATYFGVPLQQLADLVDGATPDPINPQRRFLSGVLQVVGTIEPGVWIDADTTRPSALPVIPICPDPRWPADQQRAYQVGPGEYVSVRFGADANAGDTVVLERRLERPALKELSIARVASDLTFQTLDGRPIRSDPSIRVTVLGIVLWRIVYHGP